MDGLLKQGRRGDDLRERTAIYQQAQALFRRDMPWVPLYHVSVLHGLPPHRARPGRRAPPGIPRYRQGMEDAMMPRPCSPLALAVPAWRARAGGPEGGRALGTAARAGASGVEKRLDGVLGALREGPEDGRDHRDPARRAFPQASSIKLAVLYELYRQAEEGKIDLAEVTRPPAPRVEGGGVLQELGDMVSLTWRDLAVLMMGWSDNEATNVLIDRLGMDAVNRRLDDARPRRTRACAGG